MEISKTLQQKEAIVRTSSSTRFVVRNSLKDTNDMLRVCWDSPTTPDMYLARFYSI